MSLTNRYIARITIEAETPMAVGSGEKGINIDRLVAKDANGLPYIPGTSLTGVLRHSFGEKDFVEDIFGSGGDDGKGSRLIVSSAFLIGEDGKTVMDGLRNLNLDEGYYSYFSRLPERDHVRINHKGTADSENRGKFDEELVHRGARFVFELELKANDTEDDKQAWDKLLSAIASPTYRIGAGTRKGFGSIKIIKDQSKAVSWNLKNEEHLKAYLQKSSSLNSVITDWNDLEIENESKELKGWQDFSIQLKAKDFFTFSAGFGDDQADNKPKKERCFDWSDGKPKLTEREFTLIPATSIKGALSHRVAYHYNLLTGNTIGKDIEGLATHLDLEAIQQSIRKDLDLDSKSYPSDSPEWDNLEQRIGSFSIEDISEWDQFIDDLNAEVRQKGGSVLPVGENNKAVQELFGYAKNSEEEIEGQRGRVLIEDIYLPLTKEEEKVFNHTSIDRFTNATIDGALFQEKISFYKDKKVPILILVEENALTDTQVEEAFLNTLDDLKNGRLALGGSTTKGHGMFKEDKE